MTLNAQPLFMLLIVAVWFHFFHLPLQNVSLCITVIIMVFTFIPWPTLCLTQYAKENMRPNVILLKII